MAFSLGTAILTLKANAQGLTQGLTNAKTQSQSAMQTMTQHSRQIGIAFTAAGAAIVGGAVLMVKSFAESGDEIQKMALRTGFATETLSELKHAAELSGASLSTIETATKKMSRVIFEAGQGTATYTEVLSALGLTYTELQGLSPEQQFITLATALADVEDHTTKAALAQELFGRSGTELIPMLAEGSAGLAAMRQEAHDLGIVFDQEAADAAAEFQDNMLRLQQSMRANSMEIAQVLIPILNEWIPKITDVILQLVNWSKANPQLTATLVKVGVAAGAIMLAVGPLLIALPTLVSLFGGAAGLVGAGGAAAAALGGVGAALAGPLGVAAAAFAAVAAITILISETGKLVAAKRGATEATKQAEAGERALIKQFQEEGVRITEAEIAGLSHNEMIALLTERLTEAEQAQGREISAMNGVTKATDESTGAIQRQEQEWVFYVQGLDRGVIPALQSTQGVLLDTIFLANELASFNFGGGGIPGQAFASGGIVKSPIALVGERGPELASFPQGTRITPARETERLLGGGKSNTTTFSPSIHVTVDQSAVGDPEQFAEEVNRALFPLWDREMASRGFDSGQ